MAVGRERDPRHRPGPRDGRPRRLAVPVPGGDHRRREGPGDRLLEAGRRRHTAPTARHYEVGGIGGSWFRYAGNLQWSWQRDCFDYGNAAAVFMRDDRRRHPVRGHAPSACDRALGGDLPGHYERGTLPASVCGTRRERRHRIRVPRRPGRDAGRRQAGPAASRGDLHRSLNPATEEVHRHRRRRHPPPTSRRPSAPRAARVRRPTSRLDRPTTRSGPAACASCATPCRATPRSCAPSPSPRWAHPCSCTSGAQLEAPVEPTSASPPTWPSPTTWKRRPRARRRRWACGRSAGCVREPAGVVGRDHAVELPAPDQAGQARPRAGCGLHGRAQAGSRHAVVRRPRWPASPPRTPTSRPASSTWSPPPTTTSGRCCRPTRGSTSVSFTGSTATGRERHGRAAARPSSGSSSSWAASPPSSCSTTPTSARRRRDGGVHRRAPTQGRAAP